MEDGAAQTVCNVYAYNDEECLCDCSTCDYRDNDCDYCDDCDDCDDVESLVRDMLHNITNIRSALIARNPEDSLHVAMMSDSDCIDEVMNDYHFVVTEDMESGEPNTLYAVLKDHMKLAIKLTI